MIRNGILKRRRKSAIAIFNKYVLVTVRKRDERTILIKTKPFPKVPIKKSIA
jgi:hypothetical protein